MKASWLKQFEEPGPATDLSHSNHHRTTSVADPAPRSRPPRVADPTAAGARPVGRVGRDAEGDKEGPPSGLLGRPAGCGSPIS